MKNGILDLHDIEGVEIEIDLIPITNTFARPQHPMNAESITIHETANFNVGANADMHTEYVDNIRIHKSWHFSVDDVKIIQELPINENAWAGGDGANGKGNRTSIHIEICVNKDGDFEKAKSNAIKLIRFLKKTLNIFYVYPHRHWSGKNCPAQILASGWDKFLLEIDRVDKDWKQLGLEWLQDPKNINPPISKQWSKTDTVDMGTLGEILSRRVK